MNKLYFYEISEGEHDGPISLEELSQKDIKADTYIWSDGMDEWLSAKDVPEVAEMFTWIEEPQTPPMPTPPPMPKRGYVPDNSVMPEPAAEPALSAQPIPETEDAQSGYSEPEGETEVESTPPEYFSDEEKPASYLVWSIITTILCCWPFGIPAIIYSSQVESKWNRGDHAGAKKSSENAKIWCWVSFGAALAYILFIIILAVCIFAGSAAKGNFNLNEFIID